MFIIYWKESVQTSGSSNRKGVHARIKMFVAALFEPPSVLRALCDNVKHLK